jgi:hypothetical protein
VNAQGDKIMNYDDYIREAYKDLQEPDYRFVGQALENGRYDDIASALTGIGFSVVDDTEPNTDVCRTLIVTKDELLAVVKLSFAGPFAAVFRLKGDARDLPRLVQFLDDRGISVLSQATLSEPYQIALFDLDDEPTLYSALFSTEPMPS